MNRNTPPKIGRRHLSLRGLRTFATAARLLSFRLAAEELFITASAVSHQIKALEQEVDAPLFERRHRRIVLTDAGRALYDSVSDLIDQIDKATAPFLDRRQRRVLRLSVQPFFASEQLLPKLASFTEDHPHIDIHLDSVDEQTHRHPATVDASVRVFRAAPEGLKADAFYPLRQVPGASPALMAKLTRRAEADDSVFSSPFPMIVHSDRRHDWEDWARAAAVVLPGASRLIELNSMVTVVNAACQGVGVALIPMPLSERLFADGSLIRAHDFERATQDRYYFVTSEAAARTKPIQELRSWILTTFANVA